MRLLPSEQKERIQKVIQDFERNGSLSIYEPCDCGSHVRHNNGGNYHDEIFLKRDSNSVFVKFGTSCDLVAPAEWEEIDNSEVDGIIRRHADWP